MSQISLSAQTLQLNTKLKRENQTQHPFLDELIEQIRFADTYGKYRQWSDEVLINRLIIPSTKEELFAQNLNLDPLNQLLINAYYHAIAKKIEQATKHLTETYVHVRNKEFSSAVIFCGGVLVLNSLISGYKSLKFISLQELIGTAEKNVESAVIKASYYLDF